MAENGSTAMDERMDRLESKIDKLTETIGGMAVAMGTIKDDVSVLKTDVSVLKRHSNLRWCTKLSGTGVDKCRRARGIRSITRPAKSSSGTL